MLPTTQQLLPASSPAVQSATSMQAYEGQLNKFTNVVKGWQYRWFVLTPETGQLNYYLMDEGVIGKLRGGQHVAGTVVVPSDEDSQTFVVNFAIGESYKLRAANVRERQVWVDRIRAVAQRHESAMARDTQPAITKEFIAPPPGSKSMLGTNGEPSQALQHLSLSVLDAFGSVHDILHQTDAKHVELAEAIESLPSKSGSKPGCHDDDLLTLKATSHASLQALEAALNILQDLRDLQLAGRKNVPSSPKKILHNFEPETPSGSTVGSPHRFHDFLHDTLSIQSSAEATRAADVAEDRAASLSASSPNIDHAGSVKAS